MEVPGASGFPFHWHQRAKLARAGAVIARRASVGGDRSSIIARCASFNGDCF